MASSARPEWRWLYGESRPFLRFQLASLLSIAASGVAGLAPPLLMKWLIDEVLPHRRWGALALVTGVYLCSAISRSALASLGTFLNLLGVKRMTFRTHMRLVRHVQSLSAEFHTRHPVGDLLQRLERDVLEIGDFTSDVLPMIARIAVGTMMAIAAMVYLDWRLTSVLLLVLPVFVYSRHRYRTVLRQWALLVREASSQQSSFLQEMLAGAVQIQLLGAERRLARAYTRVTLLTIQRQIRQRRHELMYAVVSTAIIGSAIAFIIGYGGVRVLTGGLSIGGLVAFYGYINSIFSPLNTAVGLFARMVRMQVSIQRLIEIEQTPDIVRDAPDAVPLTAEPRVLACRNVSFDYGPDKRILRHTHFQARAGERVAVVGESGSGKSSLLKLVVRLHDVTGGTLELDGHDIRSLQLESLRHAISFVPQDPVLFQGTLRANLRYGCPTATMADLEQAAWTACLTDVIARLPRGWDTELGRMGAGLSGGERQRVAIARALMQERPILILDEAFSALDSAGERRLLARLEGWAKGRMLILVSHRLYAAQWADRVVVLHQGEVVEDATHERLFHEGTYYNALWQCRDAEERAPR